ncbi:hypothetical protein JD844_008163 [Phrynosoma platyrhinos]|uniref:Uncharacterized protein n=1 Tax=Phrynosoma platyrhinos TaxID=52577 RepID=A0ABQ7TDJ5_PHRPL|nr:hypothetical protein JD844_008163 [Phrynosoma platyrhinos]
MVLPVLFSFQVQDKFRLDLSDEEAVHYMQSLIDESVHALFAAMVEQIHKFAQDYSEVGLFIMSRRCGDNYLNFFNPL